MRHAFITVMLALVGALVSIAFWPQEVPVLGLIIGGTVGYGLGAVTKTD